MSSTFQKKYEVLTDEQVQHFLDHGYVIIKNAFPPEKAAQYTKDLWIRIGYDPDDKSTWKTERLHLPKLRYEVAKTFSPKAWGAMCDLLGGEERISPNSALWGDSFIINFGTEETVNDHSTGADLTNWHVDGDFFLHFLDSPEQALLVIPIYSKIEPRGGGTYIAPNSINSVARRLADRPDGIQPGLGSEGDRFNFMEILKECGDHFVELTGDIGDVVLMHPLMLHSASINALRIPRILTNPAVSLNEPFNFNREDPSEYSLVEKKTLKALGVDRLDYKITAPRQQFIPAARHVKNEMAKQEIARLKEHALRNGLPVPDIAAPA
ncbi:hypothetical protein FRC03_005181 [Tulasnella sp. 419]|nr:hypothetical protein FRC03_005181 [Tulasnella sp. 419]